MAEKTTTTVPAAPAAAELFQKVKDAAAALARAEDAHKQAEKEKAYYDKKIAKTAAALKAAQDAAAAAEAEFAKPRA